MIKALSFGNYKSFQDKQIIIFDSINNVYVTYGKNSSGKSNLYNFFKYIRQLTCSSVLDLEELRTSQNIFSHDRTLPLDIVFELEGKEYSYELNISYDTGVLFEELSIENEVIFTCKNNKVISKYFTQPLLDRLTTYDKQLSTVLGILFDKDNNVSLRETVETYDFTILRNFFTYIFKVNGRFETEYVANLEFRGLYFEKILEEIQAIDVGIDDIEVSQEDMDMIAWLKSVTENAHENKVKKDAEDILADLESMDSNEKMFLMKAVKQKLSKQTIDVLHGDKKLPYKFESKGTKIYIDYIATFLYEYNRGRRVFVFDELDASLSSALVMRLIRFFNKNFQDAQLIFTTHNTSLLHKNKELNLTKKNYFIVDKKEYSSEIYRLSSFQNLRDDNRNNFEKMYLSGRFGGIHEFKE